MCSNNIVHFQLLGNWPNQQPKNALPIFVAVLINLFVFFFLLECQRMVRIQEI
jgi:hypothetical protein